MCIRKAVRSTSLFALVATIVMGAPRLAFGQQNCSQGYISAPGPGLPPPTGANACNTVAPHELFDE